MKIEQNHGKSVEFASYKCGEATHNGYPDRLMKLFSEPCGSNIRKETKTENVSPMSEDSDVDELVDTPMIKVENIEIEDDQGWM